MAIIRTYAEVLKLKPNTAEKDLIEKCQAGEKCVLGYDVPTEPSDSRTIRADILRYLLLGGCETCRVDGRGVWLVGGYISGTLNIDFATIHGATQLQNCHFDTQLDSEQTRFKLVSLNGSTLNGWFAQGAKIEGSVFLRDITASATIDLNGATIGGQLACEGASLTAKAGHALNAQGAKIEGGVFLRDITAAATIDLNGATIGGQLACEGAKLTAKAGHALNAHSAKIEGGVFLDNITASATIDLNGATIGGQLSCEGAKLTAKAGHALNAHSAKIEGGVFLRDITASATIALNSAAIGGQLACAGARITTEDPYALIATNAQIAGGVFLHPRTQTDKDKIETPFHATGELRFNGATLGGVYGEDITLEATTSNTTLSLGGATITGSVRLSGCTSTGEMMLAGSKISGRLICEKARFQNTQGHAFNGKAMRVDRAFIWKKLPEEGTGAVSLNGAHVEELDDDPENWPKGHDLHLDGFTYTRITAKVATVPARMDWLKLGSDFDGEFRPQPYSQYAKFLRDTGHDEDSRRVLFKREQLRRASARDQLRGSNKWFAEPRILWSVIWDILLRYVVGYGHHPFRSVFVLATLICVTIVPAHYAWEEGSFAPNSGPILVSEDWRKFGQSDPHPAAVWAGDRLPDGTTGMTLPEWKAIAPGRDWETFNRYAYGFDVVIPIIDFGQTDAWAPSTTRGDWGKVLWVARWVLSVMGWIVTALGAAAITGIIRRE